MTFELRITFSGLCLFVAENNTLHVLLPKEPKDSDHGGGFPKHRAVLEFAAHYVHKIPVGFIRRDLRGKYLDFSCPTDGRPKQLPEKVVNYSPIVGDVPVDLDKKEKPECVTSRVELTAGRYDQAYSLAKWRFPDLDACDMANWVRWTLDIEAPELVLAERRIGSKKMSEKFATLTPKDGRIDLLIRHIPRKELDHPKPPERPHSGYTLEHIRGYFSLFKKIHNPAFPVIEDLALATPAPLGCSYTCVTLGGNPA
jgi:hypothetical protein